MIGNSRGVEAGDPKKSITVRIFGNRAYARLFGAQTVTSIGDWLGLIAISILATEIGASSPEASIGFVLAARLLPGLFFSQLAGVFADKMDRRKLMMVCDLSRAGLLLLLPFVNAVWHLIVISLFLELFTLLWIPAKEAMVPNIVPKNRLATVNSFSLLATYGTFPLASLILLLVAPISKVLDDIGFLNFLRITDTSIAFYIDSLTFVGSALLVYSMTKYIKKKEPKKATSKISKNLVKHYVVDAIKEIGEGIKYIAVTPVVRGVNLGLGTALLGGGMLIPLGTIFATDVLGAGTTGYAAMQAALGSGAAVGVITLIFLRRLYKKVTDEHIFVWASLGAGFSLIIAVTFNILWGSLVFIGLLGVFAGSLYVAGFTIIHARVANDIRGRVFSSLYTLMRMCVLFSLVIGPFLATLIGRITRGIVGNTINLGEFVYQLPGVRITLWLAGIVIIFAGGVASKGFKFPNGDFMKLDNTPEDKNEPDTEE